MVTIEDGPYSVNLDGSGTNYKLKLTVAENTVSQMRNATITFNSADGTKLLGSMQIVQVGKDEEDPNTMIFVVRANYSNDFTVSFNL